jgi:adenylate kinase
MSVVLILLGPPGAGKGTQAKRLSAEFSLPHVSTGDLFREHKQRSTELGRRACEYMDAGRLVPDELVLDMLFARVAEPDCESGYLLDGFPRTVPQAEALSERLPQAVKLRAINFAVSDAVVTERMCGRRTCRKCGNNHHLQFSPPKVEGVCDACGGELYQRADDSPDVVSKRLAEYRAKTLPLTQYYAKRSALTEIDGSGAPEQVFAALKHAVQGEAA